MSQKKLKVIGATAICGNDITSSCLYVSALTILYAGQYAWICLLVVALVLFLFRKIYGEAVGALPLNGGAYNVLLNTTSKTNASVAACLTILSYMATAVISASEAMHYLHHLFSSVNVMMATIFTLSFFLVLTISGMSESAGVATFIFFFHMVSLVILMGACGWYLSNTGLEVAVANFKAPTSGSLVSALFFGFSAAMLGISGFESSANFVEEQAPGVFQKTLRNMWLAVTVINPLMALFIVCIIPQQNVLLHTEALLSHLGDTTGGNWLGTLISVDAVMVLCGAVLTSYVGVSGLMKRMALDRVLPQFTLGQTKGGSVYRILIFFYILCLSVLAITGGELSSLAGVYTISFLTVMIYFGGGNFLLKVKRASLPRPVYASPVVVAFAVFAVVAALYGNIKLHPDYLVIFLQYFIPFLCLIFMMLNRVQLLQVSLIVIESLFDIISSWVHASKSKINALMQRLTRQQFVYFSKADSVAELNKVVHYVQENEATKRLKIVTITAGSDKIKKEFLDDLEVLDRAYPEIDLEFVHLEGVFSPEFIQKLSRQWNIPVNFMFIASPGNKFPYKISELGGVRLII